MPVLTDLVIRKAKAPASGRAQLLDAKVSGLVFRVTASGVRTWSVLYRIHGERRRLTLGPYRPEDGAGDGLTLAEARAKARKVLRDVADGRDPQAEKLAARTEALRAGATFADVAERWLSSSAADEWRPKTKAEFSRIVRVELVPVFGDLAPEAVTKAHIRTLYDRIAKRAESTAKHTLAILRLFYRWAAEVDHVDTVPVFPRRDTQSNKRDRVLEEGELRTIWTALDGGGVMGEAFRLMLVTGQRRGEVLSMRWADVTEEKGGSVWWTIPAERHKGGREHRVPLTAPAVESLKRLHALTGSGPWVFPSPRAKAKVPFVGNPQKAADRLWKATGLKGSAHVHDLRRTASTYMARLGVSRMVIGRVLGHADSDVTGRYDRHGYDAEKRAALTKWADELERVISERTEAEPAKVLPWAR